MNKKTGRSAAAVKKAVRKVGNSRALKSAWVARFRWTERRKYSGSTRPTGTSSRRKRLFPRQTAMVAKLEEDGHDSAEAVEQLRDLENALESMRERRANIMKMIDQIDQGLA
ncbi:MAG TPA: hypothetical protein VH682_02660 [Gemmataceae bacterium]